MRSGSGGLKQILLVAVLAIAFSNRAYAEEPRAVVSLIVAGLDRPHVAATLENLERLLRNKNVIPGNVVIVGIGETLFRDFGASASKTQTAEGSRNPRPAAAHLGGKASGDSQSLVQKLSAMKLPDYELVSATESLKRINARHSPTWIVRSKGRDFVYEGYDDISRLFSDDGSFVGGKNR